jgi:hypothetical protein
MATQTSMVPLSPPPGSKLVVDRHGADITIVAPSAGFIRANGPAMKFWLACSAYFYVAAGVLIFNFLVGNLFNLVFVYFLSPFL